MSFFSQKIKQIIYNGVKTGLIGYKNTLVLSTSVGSCFGMYNGLLVMDKCIPLDLDLPINIIRGTFAMSLIVTAHSAIGLVYGLYLPVTLPKAIYKKIKYPDSEFSICPF